MTCAGVASGCGETDVGSSALRFFLSFLGEVSLFVVTFVVVADDDECLVLLANGWSLLSSPSAGSDPDTSSSLPLLLWFNRLDFRNLVDLLLVSVA